MRSKLLLFLPLLWVFTGCRTAKTVASDSPPVSHEIWDQLLQKHVAENGQVNYQGFIQDSLEFNRYIELLKAGHPNDNNWSPDQQKAYWINAYNAFTVQLIIRHYPLESIKDIAGSIPFVNTSWDLKFIEIEGVRYDLNNIEHSILRKEYDDPRIHFAIVCASYSCPTLRNEAFIAEQLDKQLDDQGRDFINDPRKNRIENAQKAELSKIFSWYGGEFKKKTTLIEYLNQFADTKLEEDAEISFMEYNWSLNE